jgi:hypothetical protein
LAERRSPKPQVGGSIPSWPAILRDQKSGIRDQRVAANGAVEAKG